MDVSQIIGIKRHRWLRAANAIAGFGAVLTLVGSLFVGSGLAESQGIAAPPAGKSAAQIAQCRLWIQQAASGKKADRAAAEQKLNSLDSSWIPTLQRMVHASHSRVLRHRMNALLARLSIAQATLPSLVTLNVTNIPLRRAVDDLCDQARLPHHWLKANPANVPSVTVHLTKVPFWVAMESILHQSRWTLGYAGRKQKQAIELSPTAGMLWPAEPYFISGRYLVAAEGLSFSQNFALTKSPPNGFSSNNINLNLRIFNEPRPPPPPQQINVALSHAVDNKGANLLNAPFGMPANLPPNMAANMAAQFAQFNNTVAWSNDHWITYSVSMSLNVPKKIGREIKQARGSMYWNLAVGTQKLRIKNLARDSGRSAVFAGFDIEFGRPMYHPAIKAYTIAMLLQTRQFLGTAPHTFSTGQLAVYKALQKSAGMAFSDGKALRYVAQINSGDGYGENTYTTYNGQPPTSLTCIIRVTSPAEAKLLAAASSPMIIGAPLPAVVKKAIKQIKSAKPLPVPTSLVWTLPAFQSRVSVPFVFHNLPLPPMH